MDVCRTTCVMKLVYNRFRWEEKSKEAVLIPDRVLAIPTHCDEFDKMFGDLSGSLQVAACGDTVVPSHLALKDAAEKKKVDCREIDTQTEGSCRIFYSDEEEVEEKQVQRIHKATIVEDSNKDVEVLSNAESPILKSPIEKSPAHEARKELSSQRENQSEEEFVEQEHRVAFAMSNFESRCAMTPPQKSRRKKLEK